MDDVQLQSRVVVSLFRGGAAVPEVDRVDARAWRTDPYRSARLAQAALEHVPVAATVLLSLEGAFQRALGFSQSPEFKSVVEERAELVTKFVEFLQRNGLPPSLEPVLAIDAALVDVGELPGVETSEPSTYGLAPWCTVLDVPIGLAEWHAVRFGELSSCVGATLWERILERAKRGAEISASRTTEKESVLVVRGGHGRKGSVETLSPEMCALLRLLSPSRTPAFVAGAFPDDFDAAGAQEILDGLVADGLVVFHDGRAS